MKGSARQLVSNLGTVVLTLLLAFVIWIWATLQDDPFTTQEFANVPITLVNQPDNTMLFNGSDLSASVNVQARAPQSELAKLKTSNFVATMDLSQAQPGTPVSVPIKVTCNAEAVRVEVWDPTEQIIHLEAIRALTLPVTIEVEGQVATGYQAATPVIAPDQVTIEGPEAVLTQVASIAGSVDVNGARANMVEKVPLKPLVAEGRLVPGLQWTPDQVEVQVEVLRKLGYKPDVEVVPDRRGEPAPGYRLGSVSVEPSTVTLAGLPSVLDELPGFIETWPISVTGATENLLKHTPLAVPDSVVVVGVDFVTVTIEVWPIQSSRAMTAAVEIQGVRPGWVATPSPSVVDVILEGPDTALNEIKPEDIRVILDLFSYGLGEHRVTPRVLAPEGIAIVSVIPETIEVWIAPASTPTPTATEAPPATPNP
jgi:YbbR domain-containing protein